ncbi:hypothetical protein L596_008445 [Steinernema carpocapsae]|uniref:Uncharacterized protein n=1 Tax=Steinernema carpocapsae TaxID=34508 RepID=A0A4V6A6C4_STECR|nr:hypothetical protein L596_008445 [Steinernema carpocapsae]
MSDSDCNWDDDDYEVDLEAVNAKKNELKAEDEAEAEPVHAVPAPQPSKEKPAYMKKAAVLPTFNDRELTAQEKEELQKKSDMLAGMDLCGVEATGSELDNLETIVEFREHGKKIGEHLSSRSKNKHYVDMITALVAAAVHNLDAAQVRQINTAVKTMADTKTSEEKDKKKGSAKPSIKSSGNKGQAATSTKSKTDPYGDDAVYDEYDDFM